MASLVLRCRSFCTRRQFLSSTERTRREGELGDPFHLRLARELLPPLGRASANDGRRFGNPDTVLAIISGPAQLARRNDWAKRTLTSIAYGGARDRLLMNFLAPGAFVALKSVRCSWVLPGLLKHPIR